MAKLSNSDSRRMYSWWWDSHISPKNSKWLQENLTEMDVNVKSMIKLLESDADSFARRAEMYYRKRPELMKMVEEFYRAYRALAERYDHATGVIRHAHRTMSEAFPNQMPVMLGDEAPESAVSGNDPRTPDMMSTPNGEFADELDSCTERKTLKQFSVPLGSVERVRRGLKFDESGEKDQSTNINGTSHVKDPNPSKSNQESDSEEILALKEALAKLEAEKETGLVQYQQSLDKLSQLKTEISKTQEDFKMLTEHANQAENDVSVLTEKLIALEAEKEFQLQEYLQSVDKLNERVNFTKTEIGKLSVEKDTALDQYMQSLEIISKLENTLRLTEENATGFKERAEKAENEVETLRKTISELTEEKEIIARQHQQCLESISSLEQKLSSAEEQRRLLESSNQSLHSELEMLMSKLGTQTQELTEKQKELGRLWGCVQEERLRFVEAETAFQTLQHLHAQTQDELRAMALELQSRAHLLNVSQTQNQSFQNEISNLIESKGKLEGEVEIRLDERNALQQEIYCLKEELNDLNGKHVSVLGQVREVGLSPESLGSSVKELMDKNSRQSSEKSALLEKLEILEQLIVKNSILETSLSDLSAELEAVRGKMEVLEKSCESLSNDKLGLLDENASLVSQLQETNKNLEILSKNNAVLENFLSNVHHQLETLMAKSKILEDSCQLLVDEKAGLMCEKDGLTSQLKNTETRLEDLGKLYAELEGRCINLEKEKETTLRKVDELNMSLEVERRENASYIQMSEAKMYDLEDKCQQKKRELDQVLDCAVANEFEIFVLHTTAQVMKENNCSLLVKNQKLLKESSFLEKKISSSEQKNSEQQFEIRSLTDQAEQDRFYVNQLLDKLQIVIKSLNKSEEENLESSVELSVLLTWIRQLAVDAQNLEVVKNKMESDQGTLLTMIEGLNSKLTDMRREKLEISDNVRHLEGKNNALEEENYVLCSKMLALENLSLIFKIFADEKFMLFREIGNDRNKLRDTNSALTVKLSSTEGKLEESKIENVELKQRLQKTEDELSVEIENGEKLLNRMTLQLLEAEEKISQVEKQKLELNESVQNLKTEYVEEKRSLMDNIGHLKGKNNALEEENYFLCGKLLALDNLLLIFRIFADEKFTVFKEIADDRNKLHDINTALMGKLEESKIENVELKQWLQKTEDELNVEIENGKKLLNRMTLQLLEAEEKISQVENQKQDLNESVQNLKTDYDEEKRSLMDNIGHLKGKNNALEEENYLLCSKLLALDNLLLIFRIFADEKFTVFKEIADDRNKLHGMNTTLMGKFEESKIEIENGKKMLNQMALQLLEAEEKISRVQKQKLELNESVQNLKTNYDEVKTARGHQDNHILKLSADNERLSSENNLLHQASQTLEADLKKLQIEHNLTKIQEESLSFELENKVNEIDVLESQAILIFGQLHDSMVSRIIYEQKFHELNDVCVGYMDENEGLESQLAAYGPEIVSLKECISSLENHTDIHIKFPNPENEELQVARDANKDNNKPSVPSGAAELHNLTARLRAIVKAAAELKEVMVQENINLHSKLDDATKQLESLQSDKNGGRYRRSSQRQTSEITEADNVLLTKDIVLDQISDASSYYSLSKRQTVEPDAKMVELWETPDPSSKKKTNLRRLKSMKKQKSTISTSDFSSMDKLEISKGSNESFGEGNNNKRKILERLDSDVQKLANLQITVQDLKRKLEVTEKGKRGKAVIECESLKLQLDEADMAVVKMFELNGRLVKSIDDRSFSDVRSEKSSFDLENEGSARRRRVSEQARKMSEKIGRLQLEVQKLHFVLMKMDDGKDGKSRMSESKRRVLLRDFLYGGGRKGGQGRKKTQFCGCVQPSTVED
ncbi:hypothetical protein CASFOL_010079 [Castilleja foliolosa]|uniref:NAB domain-containing protein n=1 Tax=Castilleja foliolosa TaxID=1961234 RepID=A0ABD3DV89_9LAMI